VRCGEWDTQNQIEPYPHQDRYGADVQIHPEFNPRESVQLAALVRDGLTTAMPCCFEAANLGCNVGTPVAT